MNDFPANPAGSLVKPIQGDYWLSSSEDSLRQRPELDGDRTVDVAILGGGLSGLWTAYHLLRQEPSLDVAVVEAFFCGYGASGRNGGWVSPRFPTDVDALVRRFGPQRARETVLAQLAAVDRIGRILGEEGIDAHFERVSLLSIARGAHQLPIIEKALANFVDLGVTGNRLIDADEARRRVHVTRIAGALETEHAASVHPGRLVRGLARAVEQRRGVIYENTPVTALRTGTGAALVTSRGVIRARKAVVAAGEAYLSNLPQFRRTLMPMSSMIVLTAPLTSAQWEAVGWAGRELLTSQVHTKNYLTRTRDGRILYGSRGAPYRYGSRMDEKALSDAATFERMHDVVREWWPALADVEFTHAWGGYLGVPRDWLPTVSFDGELRLARLHGYTGRGVTTSAMCAELLAGLITGRSTGLETLPMHRPSTPKWEIEPFRWAGVRYVQNAFGRIDEAERDGRRGPADGPIAEWLFSQ